MTKISNGISRIGKQQTCNYISLILVEIELTQRIHEIKENFVHSDDSKRVVIPILDRISKIKSEKLSLNQESNLH